MDYITRQLIEKERIELMKHWKEEGRMSAYIELVEKKLSKGMNIEEAFYLLDIEEKYREFIRNKVEVNKRLEIVMEELFNL